MATSEERGAGIRKEPLHTVDVDAIVVGFEAAGGDLDELYGRDADVADECDKSRI